MDPWLFEVSAGFPILRNNIELTELILGSFEFKAKYFIRSEKKVFRDHLLVEIQVSSRKIGLSVCFIEPF